QFRNREFRRPRVADRERSAELLPPLEQIGLLLVRERDIGGLVDLLRWYRDVEPIAEGAELVLRQLLLLMGDVLALAGLAHAVALHGFDEDDRRLALVSHRAVVGGEDLPRVVAAAAQRPDVGVGPVLDERRRLRVLAEEMFADVGAGPRAERLVVAVERLVHQLAQPARFVLLEENVPARAPDQLDHVPAGAPEV